MPAVSTASRQLLRQYPDDPATAARRAAMPGTLSIVRPTC